MSTPTVPSALTGTYAAFLRRSRSGKHHDFGLLGGLRRAGGDRLRHLGLSQYATGAQVPLHAQLLWGQRGLEARRKERLATPSAAGKQVDFGADDGTKGLSLDPGIDLRVIYNLKGA